MAGNSVYFDLEVRKDFGYVTSSDRVNEVIAEFEIANTCKFSNIKKKGNFGKTDPSVGNHVIRWNDRKDATARLQFDGVPFIIGGTSVFDCQHGVDRKASSKVRQMQQQKRLMFQRSKKMNCPAQIIVREILKFPDYKIPEDGSRWKKEELSREIRSKVFSHEVIFERRFYISYPTSDAHNNHVTGEYAGMSHPMDKRLVSYVSELVEDGMTDVKNVQRQLKRMVHCVLFPGKTKPAMTNRRLFPTTSAIRSQIHRAKIANRHSKIDPENVQQLIHKLQDDSIKFRPPTQLSSCLGDDGTVTKQTLLFIHQTKWQQRLLQLYGNDLALLDAAHNRTHFTLPLFFVIVKTNLNYQIVASFVTEDESQESITEALSILSAWNPSWKPESFMTDYCDAEIHSLENVFPACTVYVSDFHREQAWERWTTKPDHGVSEDKEAVLTCLRKVAHSPNNTTYHAALNVLQDNDIWKRNRKLRNWFEKTWLTVAKKWVWAYREDRLLVALNTNEGIEQQNNVFKYYDLLKHRKQTLSEMLRILCEECLPDKYHEYLLENVRQSNFTDFVDTPEYLHNRPHYFINHCLQESQLASTITWDMVTVLEDGSRSYIVWSSKKDVCYSVYIGDSTRLPSCGCDIWQCISLPCKHMFAIFNLLPNMSWYSFPEHYRESPLLKLDLETANQDLEKISHSLVADSTEENDCESVNVQLQLVDEGHDNDATIPCASPDSKSKMCRSVASRCRDLLKQIAALTYLVNDQAKLEKLEKDLQVILDNFTAHVRKDDNGISIAVNEPSAKKRKVAVANESSTETNIIILELI